MVSSEDQDSIAVAVPEAKESKSQDIVGKSEQEATSIESDGEKVNSTDSQAEDGNEALAIEGDQADGLEEPESQSEVKKVEGDSDEIMGAIEEEEDEEEKGEENGEEEKEEEEEEESENDNEIDKSSTNDDGNEEVDGGEEANQEEEVDEDEKLPHEEHEPEAEALVEKETGDQIQQVVDTQEVNSYQQDDDSQQVEETPEPIAEEGFDGGPEKDHDDEFTSDPTFEDSFQYEEEHLSPEDNNLLQMVRDASSEKDVLSRISGDLQNAIVAIWKQRRGDDFENPLNADAAPDMTRSQYMKTLEQCNKLIDAIIDKKRISDEKVERLNAKLDAQDEKATELCDAFKSFKREIAREAEFNRTGKPMKLKRILAFEATEEEKDKEVEGVRLKNIHYQQQLEKLQQELKQKEELAEGLHLIDFEQLKIENQTLNEKIEERNDELHKLRKKTTTTVQVLTHTKEKLKYVESENRVLKDELCQFDEQLTNLRDKLTKAKLIRDRLRAENATLKQKQGFVGSDLLVSDYEKRKNEIQKSEAQLAELKDRHKKLTRVK